MKSVFIFDFDGVIADSLEAVISIYNRVCHKYGVKEINNKKEFTDLFNGNFYDGLAEAGIPQETSSGLLREITAGIVRETKNISLFPGVKEMLGILSRESELVIITSNSSRVVDEFLNNKKIKDIREVVGVESGKSKVKKIKIVKNKNPDAKIYYIGDTTGDIYEGRKAGVVTVAATWGFHGREKMISASPDVIIDKPLQLLEKVGVDAI
jgi:phosphoglycolate phosphatase-like HAD superfamily hydrolase